MFQMQRRQKGKDNGDPSYTLDLKTSGFVATIASAKKGVMEL
jgi:hypothetical protein